MIPVKDNIPMQRLPLVTLALIGANVVIYVVSAFNGGGLFSGPDAQQVAKYGAIPFALSHGLGTHCGLTRMVLVCGSLAPHGALPAWQTAFTAMFMHASIVHLVGNMLFLWIFGPTVEDAMGHVKYLAFYIAGGLAALALEVAVAPNSTAPTVGAAGAISAVLGGYILLYPRGRVLTFVALILFVTVIELPVVLVIALWFVEQAVFAAANLVTPNGSSGAVAYFAHIGGFAFGLLVVRLLATKPKHAPPAVLAH